MGFKAIAVHYKNKFPKASVNFTEDYLNVTAQDGTLLVALKRGGGGVLVDAGEELGAEYKHCISPIPKNARLYKLTEQGRIELDELHADRRSVSYTLAGLHGGEIPSIADLKKSGYEFDGESVKLQAE